MQHIGLSFIYPHCVQFDGERCLRPEQTHVDVRTAVRPYGFMGFVLAFQAVRCLGAPDDGALRGVSGQVEGQRFGTVRRGEVA
jgi:hypothetical protein